MPIPTFDQLGDHFPVEMKHRIVKPGDYLYVYVNRCYVRALVTEVTYIWAHPGGEGGLWNSVHIDGTEEMGGKEIEDGMLCYNAMPWVDWLIGHAAYVGDDGFFTLEEARRACGRFRKKHKYRRARQSLERISRYLQRSWARCGDKHPGFDLKSYYRKVYV